MPLRSIEADSRDDAIAAAREQYGPTARVVGVRKVRSGGVLGFFATERYVAEVDESEPAPSERRAAQPAPASRPASRPAARPALRQDDDEAIREFSALLGRHDDESGEPAYRERGYQRPAPRDRSSEGSVPRSSAPRVGTPGGATPKNSGSRKPTGRDPWQQEPAFEEDPFPRAGRSRGAEPARSSARGAASRSLADASAASPEASTDAFPDDTDDRVDHRRDDEPSDAPRPRPPSSRRWLGW